MLSYLVSPPSGLRFTDISLTNGSVAMSWSGTTNAVQLQRSYDLVSWVNIGGATLSGSSIQPANAPKAFYRLKEVSSHSAMWARTMQTVYAAEGLCVESDNSGNSIVGGKFKGVVDFGGGFTNTSQSAYDAFIAKYDPNGTILWVKTFGGLMDQFVRSLAVDGSGNVIVTGSFSATVDFGGTTLTAPDPFQLWAADAFVAKYSPSGSLLWVRQFGGPRGDFGGAVALNGSDIIFSSRIQSQNIDCGSGITVSSAGGYDLLLGKLSGGNGTTIWARGYGGIHSEVANAMAVDGLGRISVTGYFDNGSGDLGGGPITSPSMNNTIFISGYAADGAYRWAKGFGGSTVDAGNGLAVSDSNNLILCGGFNSTATFDGSTTTNSSSRTAQGETPFVSGYNADGGYLWVTTFGGGSGTTDWANAVAFKDGEMVVTGSKGNPWNITGTFDFGTGFFIMDWSVTGNAAPVFSWYRTPQSGSTGGSVGSGVCFDADGILMTGNLAFGTVDFGGATATTGNSYSGYLTKFSK